MIDHGATRLALRALLLTLSVTETTAFARASVARQADINGVYQEVAADVLRNAYYVNGVLQSPLIESAATNLALGSNLFADATYWSNPTRYTLAAATSCISGQVATRHTHIVGQNTGRQQTIGVFVNGQVDTAFAIVERVDAVASRVSIRDATTGVESGVKLDWSTLALSTVGTAPTAYGGWQLAAVGPNGGLLWLMWCSVTGTSSGDFAAGNSRAVFVRPTGNTDDALAAILHHVQFEAATSAPTSPIVTVAASATRAADVDQMLAATATGYTRVSGSFITEGFRVGMEFVPTGFAVNAAHTITEVSAGTITTADTIAIEAAAAGRSLTVGLPATQVYENVPVAPSAESPFISEQYMPGPVRRVTVGQYGKLESEPMYIVRIAVPQRSGQAASDAYVNALLTLFYPGRAVSAGSDSIAVRGDPAPFAGQLLPIDGAWVAQTVSIPVRTYATNAA